MEYESRRDADDAYHEMHNKRIGRDDLLKIEVCVAPFKHFPADQDLKWARTPPSASWRFDSGRDRPRDERDGRDSRGSRRERSPPRRSGRSPSPRRRDYSPRKDDRREREREFDDRRRSRSPDDRDREMKDDRGREDDRENGTNGDDRKGFRGHPK